MIRYNNNHIHAYMNLLQLLTTSPFPMNGEKFSLSGGFDTCPLLVIVANSSSVMMCMVCPVGLLDLLFQLSV